MLLSSLQGAAITALRIEGALRRVAEKLIIKARRLGAVSYTPFEKLSEKDKAARLAVKRQLSSYLPRWGTRTEAGGTETKKVDLIEKVLVDLAKRFDGRPGGYTRIIKIGERRGDNAPMAIIELVTGAAEGENAGEKKAKAKAPAKAKKEDAAVAAG